MINILIRDSEFIRGNVPMSKEEVRASSLLKLGLKKDDIALDIGAGTGSMTIAMAFACRKVYSIEDKKEAYNLVERNIEKFFCENIELILGKGPFDLPNIDFDKIFVGGSGGNLIEIFDYIDINLKKGGVLVLNFILLENMALALTQLKSRRYREVEVISLNVARNRKVGEKNMMIGENPIYIIRAEKE